MAKRHYWIAGLVIAVMVASSVWSLNHSVSAQGGNLLTNGSFEPPYYGQGAATRTVPNGWSLIVAAGAPDAFPHTDKTQVLDGEVSWNLKQGYAVFTAIAYQRVGGFSAGDGLSFTAYGWIYTCNDTATSCVIPDPPYRKSDTSAGASLRIGIDPQGGTDPGAASVTWSGETAPYDQWAEMNVTANANGDAVTVFLRMTQANGLAINNVYWDKASLVRTVIAPNATPTSPEVPFVVAQNVRPDGSIVHVVQANDTLSSIAYAYRDYGVTTESIAALNPGMKPNTRFLQIGQEVMILPPGSVDPATGQLIPAGTQRTPTPTAAATLPPAGTPVADQQALPTQETPAGDAAAPAPVYATIRAAYVPFEHGIMFWVENRNEIFVLINGASPLEGTYSTYMDTWREGMPETDPNITPDAGFFQPTRNFGQAWRTYPGVRDSLGWGTAETTNYTALVVQDNNKVILSGPDNRVYEFAEDGTWRSTDYYLAQ